MNSANLAKPTFRFVNTSNTTFTFRFALTIGNGLCQKTDSVLISVLPKIENYTIKGTSVVCPNSKNISYQIDSLPTSITKVIWKVLGGKIGKEENFANGTKQILVDWAGANEQARIQAILQNPVGCRDTLVLSIKIKQVLKPSKPAGKAKICADKGQKISYETQKTNGSSYIWSVLGGEIVAGQGTNSVLVNWKKSNPKSEKEIGLLWLTESSSTQTDKCSGNSDTLQVEILNSPDTTLRIAGETEICEYAKKITYQYGNNLSYHLGSKYVWQVENGEIVAQDKNTVTINWQNLATGSLRVLETLPNGCVGNVQSIEVKVLPLAMCLKIPTLLTATDKTFPFWQIIGLENYPNSELQIHNLLGQMVYQSSSYKNNFDFSTLANGVYVYLFWVQKGQEKVGYRGKILVAK